MSKTKVFLDSNIFKFSATELPRLRPKEVIMNWGGKEQRLTAYEPVIVNPNDTLPENSELKTEVTLLPQVAALAAEGLVLFQICLETQMELSYLPKLDSRTGYFFDAERQVVSPPVPYGRTLFEREDEQYDFLCSLDFKRFHQLQRITGAYQGKNKINKNQLVDAFYLWCAEHNGCDFFLSLDFKLAKVTKGHPTVPVVRPSELLAAICPTSFTTT